MEQVNERWHLAPTEPFDEAEFYPPGPVLTVHAGGHTVEVSSEGERYLERAGDPEAVRDWQQFRARFPGGRSPDDGDGWVWINNGWFAVAVDGDYDGEEVCYSLAEAVEVARDHAARLATGG